MGYSQRGGKELTQLSDYRIHFFFSFSGVRDKLEGWD